MKKPNKECIICGKEYRYCNRCGEDRNKPIWMEQFCCENCMNIYNACAGYIGGNYSAEDAKALLDMCDLNEFDKYPGLMKNTIYKINELTAVKEEPAAISVEEVKTEEVIVANNEAKVNSNKNNYYKKNKKKNK